MVLELGVEPQMGWNFLLGMIFMFHRLHRKQGVIEHWDQVPKAPLRLLLPLERGVIHKKCRP